MKTCIYISIALVLSLGFINFLSITKERSEIKDLSIHCDTVLWDHSLRIRLFEERIVELEQKTCKHSNIEFYKKYHPAVLYDYGVISSFTEYKKICKDCGKVLNIYENECDWLQDQLNECKLILDK